MLTEESTPFEKTWEQVFRRGVRALRRKGVPLAVAEDSVQEAGVRAITHDVPFADAEDLLRWIQTVSWRIVLDARKRDKRLVYEVPEDASSEDVSREVEAKLRVERLGTLIGELSAEDRATLTRRPQALDRRTSTRLAVRRHRIRAQLLALLDGVAALIALLRLRPPTCNARRAAALATPLALAATAWTFVPFVVGGDAPLTPPSTSEAPTSPVAPGLVSPAASVSSQQEPKRPSRNGTGEVGRLPGVQVRHPLPGGGAGRVWAEPKQPDDSFACLELFDSPRRCVDLPVQITG